MTSPRSRPAAVRIADVAAAAGVSASTVSRALNGKGRVSAAQADHVREIAARLDYRPFGPAQALRQQLTRSWLTIVANVQNPFFAAVVRGVEDVARAKGQRLVLCNSDEDVDRERSYLDIAVTERMAGVVLAVASTDRSDLGPLVASGIPVVAVGRQPIGHPIDSVVVDNRLAGDQATQHLLDSGYERIACIIGPTCLSSSAAERLRGYKDALARSGVKPDRNLIRLAGVRQTGGYQATRSLLAAGHRPDAVFVGSNQMTMGAIQAIRDVGLRMPGDLAVVGFDDQPWTTVTSPPLTVVAQPTYELGRRAAELLATASTDSGPRSIVLEPHLLVRDSSTR
jgi:LacI family transcriptional regulator